MTVTVLQRHCPTAVPHPPPSAQTRAQRARFCRGGELPLQVAQENGDPPPPTYWIRQRCSEHAYVSFCTCWGGSGREVGAEGCQKWSAHGACRLTQLCADRCGNGPIWAGAANRHAPQGRGGKRHRGGQLPTMTTVTVLSYFGIGVFAILSDSCHY